jgi:hypothetical protein
MLAALQRPNLLILGQALGRPANRRALVVLGEFGTRFGTVLARLAATGATERDKPIQRFRDFQSLSL